MGAPALADLPHRCAPPTPNDFRKNSRLHGTGHADPGMEGTILGTPQFKRCG
jgi:hypothetical protein